ADPEHATGNYVALGCEDAIIYIAHMKENSVKVSEGEAVQEGQQIGLVGNSGNTSEPHLHIHAEKDGIGIPLRFDGKFFVRNYLVWRSEERRVGKECRSRGGRYHSNKEDETREVKASSYGE